jgi:hypothetical protein
MATKTRKQGTTNSAAAFDALIGNAPAAPSKSKKSDMPTLTLPENLVPNLDSYLQYKADMKKSETLMRENEQPIVGWAMNELDKKAIAGDYHNSYRLTDGTETITLVSVDKFSVSQEPQVHEVLKETLGDEYNNVIGDSVDVSLKEDVFTDEVKKAKFMALIGTSFNEFFDVEKKKAVKKGFAEKMYKIANTVEKVAEIRGLLVQNKPSLK